MTEKYLEFRKALDRFKKDHGLAFCPTPIRHTSDELRCQACDIVWGVDEERPPCQIKRR